MSNYNYVFMDLHTWQRNIRVPHFVLTTVKVGCYTPISYGRGKCPGCHSQPLIMLWQILAWNQVPCAKSLALCTSPPACQSWCFLNFGRALHLPAAESARCVLSGGGLHPIDPLSAQGGPWGHTPCIHTALIPAAIIALA